MLVGVIGNKGSGKDTFSHPFIQRGFLVLKMADPLKGMLWSMYRSAGLEGEIIQRKIDGDLKQTPCEVLRGATPRLAMQSLGTEWGRMIDPDHLIWSEIFRHKAEELLIKGVDVICTDIRFEHEHRVIEDLGGELVRVHRPGLEGNDPHISEMEMNRLEASETFYNTGSIEQLHAKAVTYIQERSR